MTDEIKEERTMLELKNVTYTYESKYQKVQALRGVDCTFEGGRVYAVIGKSGSGKTTMLSLIAGLDLPTGGEVLFEGRATGSMRLDDYRRQHVAMIYQSFRLFPLMTAMENVMYPMEMRKVPGAEARKRATGLIARVGLPEMCCTAIPPCSPAESSSAWQLPARLRWIPGFCWRMSRRATLIPRAAKPLCASCGILRMRKGIASSSLRTIRRFLHMPMKFTA